MVKADAMLRSCELETLLEPDLPAVEADPIQLQQVLLNLVINAFDAMRDTPLLRRKVVIATERNDDGAIRTSVRDYGVGISEEARDRLFDHFFTTKAQGLGMGLAIVRSIVESHAGTHRGRKCRRRGCTVPLYPADKRQLPSRRFLRTVWFLRSTTMRRFEKGWRDCCARRV